MIPIEVFIIVGLAIALILFSIELFFRNGLEYIVAQTIPGERIYPIIGNLPEVIAIKSSM